MNLPGQQLDIVVLCNKSDFYLTKLCVASIRHYYPAIPIYIVKDELNGRFSTKELETNFDVKLLDLGLKRYGWCTGKIAVMLSDALAGRKILLLDSDIVFAGRALDKVLPALASSDFIVSPERGNRPDSEWFDRTYYRLDWATQVYPDHTFPGYTFNCGQMVVTPGKIARDELVAFIDLSRFPYWTAAANEHLPCRDQSLLNILLPLKGKRGELRLNLVEFQSWSESTFVKNEIQTSQLETQGYPLLIHWAGALRVPYIKKMTRGDILLFYQQHYYRNIPLGALRRTVNNQFNFFSYYLKKVARTCINTVRRRVK